MSIIDLNEALRTHMEAKSWNLTPSVFCERRNVCITSAERHGNLVIKHLIEITLCQRFGRFEATIKDATGFSRFVVLYKGIKLPSWLDEVEKMVYHCIRMQRLREVDDMVPSLAQFAHTSLTSYRWNVSPIQSSLERNRMECSFGLSADPAHIGEMRVRVGVDVDAAPFPALYWALTTPSMEDDVTTLQYGPETGQPDVHLWVAELHQAAITFSFQKEWELLVRCQGEAARELHGHLRAEGWTALVPKQIKSLEGHAIHRITAVKDNERFRFDVLTEHVDLTGGRPAIQCYVAKDGEEGLLDIVKLEDSRDGFALAPWLTAVEGVASEFTRSLAIKARCMAVLDQAAQDLRAHLLARGVNVGPMGTDDGELFFVVTGLHGEGMHVFVDYNEEHCSINANIWSDDREPILRGLQVLKWEDGEFLFQDWFNSVYKAVDWEVAQFTHYS